MLTYRSMRRLQGVVFIERNDKILMCRLSDEGRRQLRLDTDAEWTGVIDEQMQFEMSGESAKRIVFEQTGLTMQRYKLKSVIEFWVSRESARRFHCYYCDKFKGKLLQEGNYGTFEWVPKEEIKNLKMGRPDRIYFKKNVEEGMKFFYYQGRYTEEIDGEYMCASLFQSRALLKREEWDV